MGLAVTYYDLYRRKIKEKGLREKEYYFITTANFLVWHAMSLMKFYLAENNLPNPPLFTEIQNATDGIDLLHLFFQSLYILFCNLCSEGT